MKVEGDYRDVFSFGDILPALVGSHFVCDSRTKLVPSSWLICSLSTIGTDASFSFVVIAVTAGVTVDCLAGGVAHVVFFK